LKSLYLLFNEGYNSSHPDQLIREALCEEAVRLVYLLTLHSITNLPQTKALLSLLCFQSSRLLARLDDKGNIILLKYQDRTKWNKPLIEKGFIYLQSATEVDEPSNYHFEATIASLHAIAPSFEQTDWKTIYHLYEALYRLQPAPIVAMNKAIASAYANSRENALEELLKIKELDNYHIYHTSLGEIYFDLNKKIEAKKEYEIAYKLTTSKPEQELLAGKIKTCILNN
jgi:RNA polymerase sigma-70 factor (ECF subfamily)